MCVWRGYRVRMRDEKEVRRDGRRRGVGGEKWMGEEIKGCYPFFSQLYS